MRSSRLLLAAAGYVLTAASVAHADTFTVYDMNSTFHQEVRSPAR